MQVFVGGGNAIFLLLTVLFTGFLLLVGLFAWRNKNQRMVRAAAGVGAVVAGIYTALLLTAAAGSSERVLSQGDTKWFCGFYLDCHLGVSISKVTSVKNIASSSGGVTAKGVFKIVTVEFHNSARNPNLDMTLYHPRAELVASGDARFERSVEAETALRNIPSVPPPAGSQVMVTHRSLLATLVFDIPPETKDMRLSIDEGFIVDRVLELVLVNDDNSIFHKRTLLAISPSAALRRTSLLDTIQQLMPQRPTASR